MLTVVTGGGGFIGSNLVDKLIDQGHEVFVIDNFTTGCPANVNKKAKLVREDIRGDFVAGLRELRPDVVFHIAALARIQPSFKNPAETIEVNSQGTVQVLEYAKSVGAKFVYAGSSSFYFDPHANPYAYSKWIGEEHCKMYNQVYAVPVAIARFFNVYGPRHTQDGENAAVLGVFERQRRNNEVLTITGTGDQKRDFTHVYDICSGLIAMSEGSWNGEVFNLGSGNSFSINEVAAMFNPKEVTHIPARPGEAWETLADLSFTQKNLNWTPKMNLPDYVGKFVNSIPTKAHFFLDQRL